MEGKTAIAAPALALGTRQGIFLARLGVQENREVSADWAVALGVHFFDAGTYHQPIDVTDRAPEEAVAHGAADFVDLHVQPPLLRTGYPVGSNGGVQSRGDG
ncbi:hypothetical protein D3C73_1180260 [compost metagenome]